MTDQTEAAALRALIEKVEAGTARAVEDFAMPFESVGIKHAYSRAGQFAARAHNGSLDAAKALHEALLPGWELTFLGQVPLDWKVAVFRDGVGFRKEGIHPRNPARAWLLAVLKAKLAEVEA